jgi:hypothetical protein
MASNVRLLDRMRRRVGLAMGDRPRHIRAMTYPGCTACAARPPELLHIQQKYYQQHGFEYFPHRIGSVKARTLDFVLVHHKC